MNMSLSEIGRVLGAVGDYTLFRDLLVTGVSTDSRSVRPGDLFVCLSGNRFDGHHFVWEAVHKGAAAVLVERPLMDFNGEIPLLLVKDSLQALGRLAAEWRRRFQGLVLGITGTAGKTTVKEFLSSILATRSRVGKNHKNWNNRLGLPLSILGFSSREQYWVLEAGVSEKHEMEDLASILKPDLAILVNVGPCHLEGLGDVDGVAAEKCRLFASVPSGGSGLVGRDYPEIFAHLPEREDLQLLSFSATESGGLYTGRCLQTSASESRFSLQLQQGELQVAIPYSGRFMLENVLAAAAAADVLGLDRDSIQAGLASAQLPEHRCQIQDLGKFQIIDDCYNANPLAMRCAISNVAEIRGEAPLVLVLGEMKELGTFGPKAHAALGEMAAQTDCAGVIYYGGYSEDVRSGFERAGGRGNFEPIGSKREFRDVWRRWGLEEGFVFFKGSRGCGLEALLEILVQEIA